MIRVLLTDDHDATLLVECPTEAAAEELGYAAIFSDGGVSAWRVPEAGRPVTADLVRQLREGSSLSNLELDADTSSSASRQHFIDTGEYLAKGEADSV